MAAKKKNQTKRRRHAKRPNHKRLEPLEKKVKERDLPVAGLVPLPPGEAKMSEVLYEFASPFLKPGQPLETYRAMFTLAVSAWNASLLPESEQSKSFDNAVDKAMQYLEPEEIELLKDIGGFLIARKNARFAEHRRMIVALEVVPTADGYDLQVASTPSTAPQSKVRKKEQRYFIGQDNGG